MKTFLCCLLSTNIHNVIDDNGANHLAFATHVQKKKSFLLQFMFPLVSVSIFALRRTKFVSPDAGLSSCLKYDGHLNSCFTEASNWVTPGLSALQGCFSRLLRSDQTQQAVSLALKIKWNIPQRKNKFICFNVKILTGVGYKTPEDYSGKTLLQGQKQYDSWQEETLTGPRTVLCPEVWMAMLCETRRFQCLKTPLIR